MVSWQYLGGETGRTPIPPPGTVLGSMRGKQDCYMRPRRGGVLACRSPRGKGHSESILQKKDCGARRLTGGPCD